jgi:hypothetical protein
MMCSDICPQKHQGIQAMKAMALVTEQKQNKTDSDDSQSKKSGKEIPRDIIAAMIAREHPEL